MSYKTILVHVDESPNVEQRIEIAASIATIEDSHLIGAAITGVSRFLKETATLKRDDPGFKPLLETLRKRAAASLKKFDKVVKKAGVKSFEHRLVDDGIAAGISAHGAYCDLIVLGQSDPDDPDSANIETPPYVILNAGCPVLIVPSGAKVKTAGSRILIAWNGRIDARRAVHDAIPLLRKASAVHVAIFHPSSVPAGSGCPPHADIVPYLERHGVKVEVTEEIVKTDIGEALLALGKKMHADLLIMGCYGHSRFRETMLGGVTRTVLKSMTIPVFMSY